MQSIEGEDGSLLEHQADSDQEDSRGLATLGEIEHRIRESLSRLPEDQRLALIMRHFENLSFKQIADVLHSSESAIKSKVYRGLCALRDELKRMGILEADCFQTA